MGGTAGSGSAGVTTQTLIELLGVKAAKDLALDMRMQSGVNVPAPVAAPPTAAARR